MQHGYGVEKWPDQSIYKGSFKHGLKEGQGLLIVANGGTYKGTFVKNQISGKGVYKWPDGKIYSGQWLDSKMHGEGHLKWPDGSREYKGQFKNDLRHGYGEYAWAFGTKSYRGQWKDGKQNGVGFVREEFEYVEKKSLWFNGKLVKWLPDDNDSDDDAVIATTNLHAFEAFEGQSLNTEEKREWDQSSNNTSFRNNFLGGQFSPRSSTAQEKENQIKVATGILTNVATQ
jgi:hypothetical protein